MISWKLKSRNLRPIGLDIGHNSIKMIQLAVDDGHISILAADKVRIDRRVSDDEQEKKSFVVSAIKQMLADGNFHGKNVVSCLPNERLKITSLRLAEAENSETERALMKEAAQRFGLDPDKDSISYLVAGSVRHGDEIKNELILFAVDGETVRSHIEMLEEAKLVPVGVDTIPCALFRSFRLSLRRQEDKERTVVFVDIGSWFTTVVLGRGGEISFVKQIPIGGENFNREIASKLGVSLDEAEMLRGKLRVKSDAGADSIITASACEQDMTAQPALDASTRQIMVDVIIAIAEELAREISLCFRYYTVTFRGKRVERAVFTGGQAYEDILLNVLGRQLAVDVEVAQPLRGFNMANVNFDGCKRDLLCEWAVAVGLSLKGWDQSNGESDEYERN